jgi:PadR family transcriptional regulator PadR
VTRGRKPSPQTSAVVLALAEEPSRWSHGYDLCRTLGLKAGTVYPILMRLADRELLETRWEPDPPPGRPPRHLYRLTSRGVAYADEMRRGAEAEAAAAAAAPAARGRSRAADARGPRVAGAGA